MRGLAAIVAIICPLSAQTSLGVGTLGGTVLDSSDRVVAGARVALTEQSKGSIRISESADDGTFLFASVLAGIYSIQVEMPGFSAEQMNNVAVEVGQQLTVEIRLHVGELRSSIAIVEPTETRLNTQSNAIGSVVNAERVRELPLNGRNFLQLALLSGGTVEVSASSDVFTFNIGAPGRLIVLPGTYPYSGAYFLDGFNIRGSRN